MTGQLILTRNPDVIASLLDSRDVSTSRGFTRKVFRQASRSTSRLCVRLSACRSVSAHSVCLWSVFSVWLPLSLSLSFSLLLPSAHFLSLSLSLSLSLPLSGCSCLCLSDSNLPATLREAISRSLYDQGCLWKLHSGALREHDRCSCLRTPAEAVAPPLPDEHRRSASVYRMPEELTLMVEAPITAATCSGEQQ